MIKQYCAALVLAAVSTTALAESTFSPAGTEFSQDQKLSYILGQNTAIGTKKQEIALDVDAFMQGLKDALSNTPSKFTNAEKQAVIAQYQQAMQAKAKIKMDEIATQNIEAGKAFITNFRSEKDVVSLDNGISYKVIKSGTGAQPLVTDEVTVHYTGKLIDGTTFDSSIPRGQPSSFPVKGVIQGWQEVLPLMKIGSKWKVVIPPQLAYKENGAGQQIGPMATLVFEIELLEIKKK